MANVWPPFNALNAQQSAEVTGVNSATEVDITGVTLTLVPKVNATVLFLVHVTAAHVNVLAARAFNADNLIMRWRRTTPNAAIVSQFAIRCPDGGAWLGTTSFNCIDTLTAGTTYTYKLTARLDTASAASYNIRSGAQSDGLTGTGVFVVGLPSDGQAY